MSKNFKFARLFDVYEGILTDRQREIMNYYYNDDMSLGEIAEIIGISRQGVRDAVKKSENVLENAETQIGACARIDVIEQKVDFVKSKLINLKQTNQLDNETIDKLISSLDEINVISEEVYGI